MVFIDLQKVSFEQVQLAVLCPGIYFVPLNGYAGPYIESKFFKPRFVNDLRPLSEVHFKPIEIL